MAHAIDDVMKHLALFGIVKSLFDSKETPFSVSTQIARNRLTSISESTFLVYRSALTIRKHHIRHHPIYEQGCPKRFPIIDPVLCRNSLTCCSTSKRDSIAVSGITCHQRRARSTRPSSGCAPLAGCTGVRMRLFLPQVRPLQQTTVELH